MRTPSIPRSLFGRCWCTGSLIGAAWLATVMPAARAQSVDSALEHRVKAAYLYNFTKFIEWPPPASADGPFVLGVLDPGGGATASIAAALEGKSTAGGRSIEVRRLTELGREALSCHQIFVTRESGVSAEQMRAALDDAPVLVVGETENFAARGGTIGLVLSGDAVRCEVNLAGAERAGLKLSGRLASIARLVREVPRK